MPLIDVHSVLKAQQEREARNSRLGEMGSACLGGCLRAAADAVAASLRTLGLRWGGEAAERRRAAGKLPDRVQAGALQRA